eukprot:8567877-Ditylum_brightwellii.AAC.1
MVSDALDNIPTHVEIGDEGGSERDSFGASTLHDLRGIQTNSHDAFDASSLHGPSSQLGSVSMSTDDIVFKVVDGEGHTYRIRCECKLDKLVSVVISKVGGDLEANSVKLKFIDDEGDTILIGSDDCLAEAIGLARNAGSE